MKNVDDYIKEEQSLIDLQFKLIEKIIQIRKEIGYSQRSLCNKIGMKQPYLVRIETKKIIPSINTLLRIIDALDCTIEIIEK